MKKMNNLDGYNKQMSNIADRIKLRKKAATKTSKFQTDNDQIENED